MGFNEQGTLSTPGLWKEVFPDHVNMDCTKLNLGCGPEYLDGWQNVDNEEGIKKDAYVDLDVGSAVYLPYPNDHFGLVYAGHILEHIVQLQELKIEIARVLNPKGSFIMLSPHFKSDDAWGDPTHVRAFSQESLLTPFWPGLELTEFKIIKLTKKYPVEHQVEWIWGHFKKTRGE